MNKETIVSRANNNKLGVKFYKSYVTNVKRVAVRDVSEHVLGYIEEDYIFSYKGKQYRVNEHIVPNKESSVKFSARFNYTVECLK